jgi:hypothetical protein
MFQCSQKISTNESVSGSSGTPKEESSLSSLLLNQKAIYTSKILTEIPERGSSRSHLHSPESSGNAKEHLVKRN